MRKNACKAFLGASGKENRYLQAERFEGLRFLRHMHGLNSSLRSFGSFSFESYAGFMRRNSFFCRSEESFRTMRQKNSDNRLIVKPAFRFTKNGASSMAFVLNRAYEKAMWVLKEDGFYL